MHRYANYSSLKDIRKKGCFDEKNDILECLMFLDMNGLLESPCNKCYKRSIIESFKLRFDMNMSHLEDFDFNLRYFPLVNSLSTINRGLYNYRRDDLNSLSRKRPFDYIELCNKLLNKRKDLFSSCQSTVKEKYFYYLDKKKELLLMPSLNLYLDGTKPKVRIDLWRRYIRVMNPIIIKSKFDVTFHDRFRALLLYTHNPYIIDFGYNILYSVRKFLPKLYNKLRNLLSAK